MATAIVSARAAPAKPRSRPTPSHKDWSTSGPERPVTHQLSGERAPGRSPDPYRRKHDAELAHYSAAMWPGFPPPLTVRHYPHLWISARGLGLSGTSTHLTRQLSGTHYELLRPCAPLRYSGPCGVRRSDVSLGIGATGPHVPHKSLFELRAACMPDAARAGFRVLPG